MAVTLSGRLHHYILGFFFVASSAHASTCSQEVEKLVKWQETQIAIHLQLGAASVEAKIVESVISQGRVSKSLSSPTETRFESLYAVADQVGLNYQNRLTLHSSRGGSIQLLPLRNAQNGFTGLRITFLESATTTRSPLVIEDPQLTYQIDTITTLVRDQTRAPEAERSRGRIAVTLVGESHDRPIINSAELGNFLLALKSKINGTADPRTFRWTSAESDAQSSNVIADLFSGERQVGAEFGREGKPIAIGSYEGVVIFLTPYSRSLQGAHIINLEPAGNSQTVEFKIENAEYITFKQAEVAKHLKIEILNRMMSEAQNYLTAHPDVPIIQIRIRELEPKSDFADYLRKQNFIEVKKVAHAEKPDFTFDVTRAP